MWLSRIVSDDEKILLHAEIIAKYNSAPVIISRSVIREVINEISNN